MMNPETGSKKWERNHVRKEVYKDSRSSGAQSEAY